MNNAEKIKSSNFHKIIDITVCILLSDFDICAAFVLNVWVNHRFL